jgi:curli biogenesis system outer membrane secretion channel CsgG
MPSQTFTSSPAARIVLASLLASVLSLTTGIGTVEAGGPKQRPALPRKSADARVAVAIYEFTSNLPEISPRGATEQFKTALVQSGQFRVVERARLSRGLTQEKQMNAAGQTTGNTAQQQLRGAEYIFEAEITELGSGTRTSSNGVNVGGLQIGGASNHDELGLDVSIVDANTGDVVDAITVRKRLKGSARSIGGLGALANRIRAEKGKGGIAYSPEVQHQSTRKDNFDAVLREAIEDAVHELAKRFDASVADSR